MKNILVTTDFSSNSLWAIRYSLNLAKTFNAKLTLFNSFVTVPAIGIDGGPGIVNEAVLSSGEQLNHEKIKKLIAELPNDLTKDVQVTAKITNGDPVFSICEYQEENDIDLVVMGTRGESHFEELLFGSTTVDVMKQANCPVLAIPPGAQYYDVKKIVYATDLLEKDIVVLKRICEFAQFFDAEVVVFHVFAEDNLTSQEDAVEYRKMLEREISYPNIKKESRTYTNTHDAILEVIKKDLANMVVMRERERGLISKLFHPDMVKRINFHTTIPLLTYNDHSLKY